MVAASAVAAMEVVVRAEVATEVVARVTAAGVRVAAVTEAEARVTAAAVTEAEIPFLSPCFARVLLKRTPARFDRIVLVGFRTVRGGAWLSTVARRVVLVRHFGPVQRAAMRAARLGQRALARRPSGDWRFAVRD